MGEARKMWAEVEREYPLGEKSWGALCLELRLVDVPCSLRGVYHRICA